MYAPFHEDSTFSFSGPVLFLSPTTRFLTLAQCATKSESIKCLTGSLRHI
jgi:hypothetical protein